VIDFAEPARRRIDDEDPVIDPVKDGAEAIVGIANAREAGRVDIAAKSVVHGINPPRHNDRLLPYR
jgi:hypothetical protein